MNAQQRLDSKNFEKKAKEAKGLITRMQQRHPNKSLIQILVLLRENPIAQWLAIFRIEHRNLSQEDKIFLEQQRIALRERSPQTEQIIKEYLKE